MLNIDIFIKRLKEVMENHHLNAAGFAEKIGVQRSSVSHILSKRNKPSLDLILKIHSAFNEITLDWLLLEADQEKTIPIPSFDIKNKLNTTLDVKEFPPKQDTQSNAGNSKEIIRIIELYKDGSFRLFLPKS